MGVANPTISRRAALTGAAAASIIMNAGGAAAMIPTTDQQIERHWQDRCTAYREFDFDDATFEDPARERMYWNRIDAAEIAILASAVRSPRTAELQLWIAWSHNETNNSVAALVTQGDYAGLARIRGDLDWHEKMLFAAIGTLRGES